MGATPGRATPLGHDGGMTDNADNLTADDLEQLAQSLAVDGSLGRADTLKVVDALRALAALRRHDTDPPSRNRQDFTKLETDDAVCDALGV